VTRQPTFDEIAGLADRVRQDTLNWFGHLERQEQDQILLGRAATLAEDLTRSTHLLVDVLERAAEALHDRGDDEAHDARALERFFHCSAINHLSVVLKAWLFDVRASQDALGHILSSIVGTGNRRSMDTRLNTEGEPVAQLIDDFAPDYRAWFVKTRDIRNRLKDGERASGMEYDPSGITYITLSAFTPEHQFRTTEKERLLIRSFLVHSLSMTRALMALVVNVADERGAKAEGREIPDSSEPAI
jgi:hypothetical protein